MHTVRPGELGASVPVARTRASLVIAGDGSDRPGSVDPEQVRSILASRARRLREQGGVAMIPAAIVASDAPSLSAGLRALDSSPGAIFLTCTDPARARAVQREFAADDGVPVVTEQETAGVAVTAALLNVLRRAGITPESARVVIAGARVLPLLSPMLMAAGVGDIVSWNLDDAPGFPLSRLASESGAVIDLVGAVTTTLTSAFGSVAVPVIAPDETIGLAVAAGLVRAAADFRIRGYGSDPCSEVEVCLACAWAVVRCTPPGDVWPSPHDPDLIPRVTRAAARAFAAPRTAH
ncbi:MAG: hypothetical protein JWQ81_3779 [Amycolatopsis sp.]|uniref:hypothetical protein n=1 Tax=Amycolatopsis sp. TaxID=37632 RepID=UPI00261A7A84|nr:hypothetical protein [Amycolatopsis sp.]MCU1683040.1 hypothetical protein [Amycolatopsis sp.]